MSLFQIDETKCKRDGFCVSDCPMGIIEMKTRESFPAPVRGADELCIKCGHCVSVCPHEAISLNFLRPADCAPMSKELSLSPEQVAYLMKSRRSIRRYKDKLVERSVLNELIEVASHAPTGHNSQPVHWLVVENGSDVRALASIVIEWMKSMVQTQPAFAKIMHFDRVISAWEMGQDKILRDAPHMMVAHALSNLPPSQAACIIALTYLEIYAPTKGLGTCWAGYFNAAANFFDPMKEALSLPAGHQTFGALMIGFPQYPYHRIPTRNVPRITWR